MTERQFHTDARSPQGRAEAKAHAVIYGVVSDWRERYPQPMVFRPGLSSSEDVVAFGPQDLIAHNIGIPVDVVRRQWGPEAARAYQEGMINQTAKVQKQR